MTKSKKVTAFFLALFLVLFSAGLAACDITPKQQQNVTPQTPEKKTISGEELTGNYVKWEGRYQYKEANGEEPAQMAQYFTATGFTVDFYGTQLKVRFLHSGNKGAGTADIYYGVAVDDEVLPTTDSSRVFYLPGAETDAEITVVSGLSRGRHRVKCLKMSEAADAYTATVSFTTDGGFYERDAQKDDEALKIMVVCASNGSGYGSLYYNAESSNVARSTANSSSLHGFMYLAARMYGADVQYVAQAGWGLCCKPNKKIAEVLDYCGITVSNSVAGAKTTAKWNWSQWTPDVVLFHIGGNDTDSTAFDEAVYKKGVVDTVEKLHALFPDAVMLWTHSGTKCGAYALAALKAAGIVKEDSSDYLAECVIPAIGSDGWGAGAHASLKTHITASERIATALEQHFGLDREIRNITFDEYASLLIQ